MEKKFDKYKQNLSIIEVEGSRYIKSYNTMVAKVKEEKLIQLGWWSKTTQKHINYAAKEMNLEIVKP